MRPRLTAERADRLVAQIVDYEGALKRAGATSEAINNVADAARRYRDGQLVDNAAAEGQDA